MKRGYRIIRTHRGNLPMYGIYEVYPKEARKINGVSYWDKTPVKLLASSREELLWLLRKIRRGVYDNAVVEEVDGDLVPIEDYEQKSY